MKDTVEIATLKPCHLIIVQGTSTHLIYSLHPPSPPSHLIISRLQRITRRSKPSRTSGDCSTSSLAQLRSGPDRRPGPVQKNRLIRNRLRFRVHLPVLEMSPRTNRRPILLSPALMEMRRRRKAMLRWPCARRRSSASSTTSSPFRT